MTHQIELSEMIRAVRRQLTSALADGADQAVRFEAGPVEIEATVVVTREATAGAKVRLVVVDAGTDGKYAHARTQRVKLTLTPQYISPNGGPPRTALISGAAFDGEN